MDESGLTGVADCSERDIADHRQTLPMMYSGLRKKLDSDKESADERLRGF